MRLLPRQAAVEWGFIACLAAGCVVLSVLQYRWTGEVSHATAEQLRSGFNGQVQLLGQAFDTELIDACNRLLPGDELLTPATREAVHVARLKRWQAGKPRPLFRRMAVAVPENSTLQLYVLDQKTPRLLKTAWPAEWSVLRDNLARKAAAGSGPPFQDSTGAVAEFPVFRNHLESEWMIFELDLPYIGKQWMPSLFETFLDPDRKSLAEATMHPWLHPEMILFTTTGQPAANPDARVASVRFNGQGWGTDVPSRRGEEDFWVLTARQNPDALEAVVAQARWRNLALALLVNGLTFLTGLALLRYARQARRVSALHLRFVANASHELRTPLTVIRGAGQNLARGVSSDPARIAQYGQFIVQHADQLTRLVERMLDMADVRRLASVSKRRPLYLQPILDGAVAATLAEARAAGCKVEAQILSRLPQVRGDAAALRQVFQNLITNAAKHAASGGWIGLKTDQATAGSVPMVEVRVEDRGPGIPASEQAHIFEPFTRGAATLEQKIQGSGLGLSLVREIVQAHGGTISLQSQPGRGTTFIVRLPALTRRAKR